MSTGLFSEKYHFPYCACFNYSILSFLSVKPNEEKLCAVILACFPSLGPQFFMADSRVIHSGFKIFFVSNWVLFHTVRRPETMSSPLKRGDVCRASILQ